MDISQAFKDRDLLYMLINNMPDFIYIKDVDSRFVIANKKLANVWHLDNPEELIGKSDKDWYPLELAQKFMDDEQAIMKSRMPLINSVETGLDEYGNEIVVSTTKIPLLNDDDEVIGIVGMGRDITALSKAQEEVKEREVQLANESGKAEVVADILHNVGNVLNSINVSVLEIHKSLDESKLPSLQKAVNLFDEHAHDLGSYLQNDEKGKLIPGFIQKVSSKLVEEQSAIFNEIAQLEKRLEVINHILELQQNVNRPSLYVKLESLNEMLDTASEILMQKLINRNIKLIKHVDESIKIKCIRSKIIHVFVNLIKNSIEAFDNRESKEPLVIDVSCVDSPEYYVFTIKDNGAGIDEEHLNHIFNHGFTTKSKGFGFGLHSCATTIQEIRGKILAESAGKGMGSSIIIHFPKN